MLKFTDFEKCEGTIVALRKEKIFVDTMNSRDFGALILDKTNFYAEQGGQIFDTGVLTEVDKVHFISEKFSVIPVSMNCKYSSPDRNANIYIY